MGAGGVGAGGRYMQAWMWKITKGAAVAEVHSIEPKDPLELQGMRCNLSIGGIALKNKTQPLGEMRRQGVKCLCFLFALSGCFSSKHAVGLSAFSSSFGLRVSCIRSFCVWQFTTSWLFAVMSLWLYLLTKHTFFVVRLKHNQGRTGKALKTNVALYWRNLLEKFYHGNVQDVFSLPPDAIN